MNLKHCWKKSRDGRCIVRQSRKVSYGGERKAAGEGSKDEVVGADCREWNEKVDSLCLL